MKEEDIRRELEIVLSGKDKESLTRRERYQLIRELSGEFYLYELTEFFNVQRVHI